MNSKVCIDANLALKLVMPEPDSHLARALWQEWVESDVARFAPPLLLSEGLSVIRNRAYRNLIAPEQAEEICRVFFALPLHIASPENLARRAWELATRFNRPTTYCL